MLDAALKDQLKGLFSALESNYTFLIELDSRHPKATEMVEFMKDFAECSTKMDCKIIESSSLQFTILKDDNASGVIFRAIPNGHEFTSLILAVLNLDGKGKNLPDEFTTMRIKALKGDINLTTYMSLTCTNCPDIVQSLNIMAILGANITHSAVDGALFEEEVNQLNVQSVPTVYADGELLHVGRGGIADLLAKLEAKYGSDENVEKVTRSYDIVVAGGGPGGATAALYLARKGLKVAVVAERIGGQVNETTTIENIPSVAITTGTTLAADLRQQLSQSATIDILENRSIESVEVVDGVKKLNIKGGEIIEAPQLIIATGANWRKLGVNGEADYIGRGVAFCPHCDGPLFKGKEVAVIGGGNSGVEAAIDLSGICSKVTVLEFMETLKADEVLQEKLHSLSNVEVFTNVQTSQILGDGSKVVGVEIKDRATEELRTIDLSGIFIQIGLSANSTLFKEFVTTNRIGEIEVDRNGRTSAIGIYAAGDVTDVSYKQIVISMGEGAKAALAAFDDKIRF